MIIGINYFYWLVGAILSIIALMTFYDKTNPRRFSSGSFWLIYGLIFVLGDWLPKGIVGILVIAMALLGGLGRVRSSKHPELSTETRTAEAQRLGYKLFIPALIIPFSAVIFSLFLKNLQLGNQFIFDPKNITIIGVGFGCIIAMLLGIKITNAKPQQGIHEARRILDSLSWALVLPQMLAMLGLIFSAAGVDKAVAAGISHYLNLDYRLLAISLFVFGMAAFTILMGNAFVAFPVIMGGIGIPVLIHYFHANPAMLAAIGMLSGYCGTLMTPMAANFNLIPAQLLELKDRNLLIKVQIPTGLAILVANWLFLCIML